MMVDVHEQSKEHLRCRQPVDLSRAARSRTCGRDGVHEEARRLRCGEQKKAQAAPREAVHAHVSEQAHG